jgi:hypothetical protein
LSLKAKGLFAYLFSKPPGWQFSSKRMVVEMSESHPTILGVLQELEAAGLLQRKRQQSGRVDYFLAYSDTDASPGQGSLLGGKSPGSKNPRVKNPPGEESLPISNTDSNSNKDLESNTEPGRPQMPVSPSSIKYLSDIPSGDMMALVTRFDITPAKVRSVAEDLVLYCERKGKKYKDYRAFLLNAVKRDYRERAGILMRTPEPPDRPRTPEEEVRWQEHKRQMNIIVGGKKI